MMKMTYIFLSKLSPAVDLWGSEFENEYLLNSYDDEE